MGERYWSLSLYSLSISNYVSKNIKKSIILNINIAYISSELYLNMDQLFGIIYNKRIIQKTD